MARGNNNSKSFISLFLYGNIRNDDEDFKRFLLQTFIPGGSLSRERERT